MVVVVVMSIIMMVIVSVVMVVIMAMAAPVFGRFMVFLLFNKLRRSEY